MAASGAKRTILASHHPPGSSSFHHPTSPRAQARNAEVLEAVPGSPAPCMSPAMAGCLADKLWDIGGNVKSIEANRLALVSCRWARLDLGPHHGKGSVLLPPEFVGPFSCRVPVGQSSGLLKMLWEIGITVRV
jgi:hypothetical protein